MNTNNEHTESVRTDIMDAIRKGRIHMRPRWHFILFSVLGSIGVAIVFLTLLYVASLAVFFTRESGTFFAPSFGLRGWFALLHDLPWLLIVLLIFFLVLLEILVRRYRFVYQKPLLLSVAGIFLIIVCGGFVIAETPFHRQISFDARHGQLPPPLGMLYGHMIRPPREGEVYHGRIAGFVTQGFTLVDIEDEGTTTVLLTPQTRLPYGSAFEKGDLVVVMGDMVATDTVQAFGVREIGE